MGRRDAVQFTLEWAAEARRLGAIVDFDPGWETFGNGTSANYEGGLVHHTAFLSSEANPFPAKSTLKAGRVDLPGPLCNVAGPWCPDGVPRLVVIAAHPANHAGASGGRSMGPLPVTSLFNPRVFGLEIDYGGFVAMSKGQRKAATIFGRALVNVLDRDAEWIRAHAETSITGKWDIGVGDGQAHTDDMAAFRRGITNLADQGDDLMAASDDILAKLDDLADRVGSTQYMLIPKGGWTGEEGALIVHIGALEAQVAKLLAIVAKGADVDEKALAAELGPVIAPMLADILKSDISADGLTQEELAAAVDEGLRRVLGSLDAAAS